MFEALWQRLTLGQRGGRSRGRHRGGNRAAFGDVRARHRLGGPSSVQTALAALQRDDVVGRESDRYVVIDSLLREWIARKTF
jgi:hypothetical protein